MSSDIIIDDIADPVLTPGLLAARQGPADFPDRLNADQVLDRAISMTGGYDDFGDDTGFRERLAVMLQSLDEDVGLTRGGRITILQHAVRVMANRLRIEALVKRHPEILEIKIDRPIIIAGLPRSGTTHLVNWLARDERLRSLTLWESEEPVPPPEAGHGHQDERIRRSAELWGQFEALVPHLSAMHGMEASSIHEDNELLFMDLNSYNWEFSARLPRWIDYYFTQDRTPSYLYEKKVLQVLTWFRGPNRWILKSPQHMENLAPLKTAFPDATLVLNHRDPVAVLRSLTMMLGYCDRTRREPVDPHGLARHWTNRIERLLEACIEQRGAWSADQSLDIYFDAYMADQESVMRRVYGLSGLELTPEAEAVLLAYLNENPRNKHGKIHYDLERYFGVDPLELQKRFSFYYDRFPVKKED